MMPFAEPAGDIRAQLAAVMDPTHPKRATFLVPENFAELPGGLDGMHVVARPEGVLVTTDEALADAFRRAPKKTDAFDRAMAGILGLPEAKPDMVRACGGKPATNGWAVQARDTGGNVVTECFVSPSALPAAWDQMQAHVPPGGQVVVMPPIEAIGRRVLRREAGE
jgi:hypothetical protein